MEKTVNEKGVVEGNVTLPSRNINKELQKERLNKVLYVSVPVAYIYSTYMIGKLPDKIKNEQGLVVAGTAFGVISLAAGGIGGGGIGLLGKKSGKIADIGIYVGATSVLYSLSRGIFKQSPKVSLIASGALILGFLAYNKMQREKERTPVKDESGAEPRIKSSGTPIKNTRINPAIVPEVSQTPIK